MGKTEHRKELVRKISNIEDQNVLEEIQRLLEINFDDAPYELNEDQKQEIEQARKEIRRGEGISSEKINKEFDEWLNR